MEKKTERKGNKVITKEVGFGRMRKKTKIED